MTKRITKIKYRVYIIRDNELYERKYSTADDIVNDLHCGLSKDIVVWMLGENKTEPFFYFNNIKLKQNNLAQIIT